MYTDPCLQIYIALLKFDFFLFLGFTIQFVVVVVGKKDVEFALTIAAMPVTILILILAGYITRKESTIGMIGIIVRFPTTMKLKTAYTNVISCRPSTLVVWPTLSSSLRGCTKKALVELYITSLSANHSQLLLSLPLS